jgi:triacylglycerol lipase
MLSFALRGVLACQALLLLAITAVWMGATASAPALVAAAFAELLVLNAFVIAAVYATARLYAARLQPAGGNAPAPTWRSATAELVALFATFVVIQPFERWWMGTEPVGRIAPGRVPVLLVHGYLCNRGMWWWLRRRLRARGFTVATVNLEPPLADLDRLAALLAQRVDALLAHTGADKVAIVGHSLGGVISRAYLRRSGAAHVAGVVTLAAPHHGTRIAWLGWGRNGCQMQPDNQWLRCLNAAALPPIPIASIWSVDDELVAPPDSARLAGTRETILTGVGHMAMVFSPRVVECLEAELAQLSNGAAHTVAA